MAELFEASLCVDGERVDVILTSEELEEISNGRNLFLLRKRIFLISLLFYRSEQIHKKI